MTTDDTLVLSGSNIDRQICSICKNRLQEHPTDPNKLQCTVCLREYMPATEVIEGEDEMGSIHEDENVELGGIGASDPLAVEADDDIMKPKYGKTSLRVVLGEGDRLVDYKEEIPDA